VKAFMKRYGWRKRGGRRVDASINEIMHHQCLSDTSIENPEKISGW